MQQDHQQEGLHMLTNITYSLQAGKYSKDISQRACTCQPVSLTFYKQANATSHQQKSLHMSSSITYSLKADKCYMSMNKMTYYHLHSGGKQ